MRSLSKAHREARGGRDWRTDGRVFLLPQVPAVCEVRDLVSSGDPVSEGGANVYAQPPARAGTHVSMRCLLSWGSPSVLSKVLYGTSYDTARRYFSIRAERWRASADGSGFRRRRCAVVGVKFWEAHGPSMRSWMWALLLGYE